MRPFPSRGNAPTNYKRHCSNLRDDYHGHVRGLFLCFTPVVGANYPCYVFLWACRKSFLIWDMHKERGANIRPNYQ